jgi:hypothetical protein
LEFLIDSAVFLKEKLQSLYEEHLNDYILKIQRSKISLELLYSKILNGGDISDRDKEDAIQCVEVLKCSSWIKEVQKERFKQFYTNEMSSLKNKIEEDIAILDEKVLKLKLFYPN